MRQPKTEIDARYGDPGATAAEWSGAETRLEHAELFWLSTIRPEGRPHVTPLVGVWLNDAFSFCTGPEERKAMNLHANPQCAITTGTNTFSEGFDIVIEGRAERITDSGTLQQIADAYLAKYGPVWKFTVRDDGFVHGDGSIREDDHGPAHVYEVKPVTAFGFGKGPFSQTRWRFT